MRKESMEKVMEKIHEWRKLRGAIITIDIKGAFDNISHNAIEEMLIGYDCKELMMHMIRTATVDINGRIYKAEKGVPQGTKLGPALYNLATTQLLEKMKVKIGEENIMAYADDIIWSENEYMMDMNWLRNEAKKIGLEIQEKKT
jgi:retron-type reverse transcriptase